MIDKNSVFYIKSTEMLTQYIANGGNIDDLGNADKEYKYIKDARIKDEAGNYIDLETKFTLLGFPRNRARTRDIKQQLIDEINAYKKVGGNFHVTRKSLPFYPTLHTYARKLKNKGVDLSYEQIMKGLGYKDYSDTYFRCQGIFELQLYRDKEGFVDDYRKSERVKSYIVSLGKSLNLPYYLVITLLADEKLKKCYIDVEYINQVKTELHQFVKEHGSLKKLKTKNKNLYNKFRTLMNCYGDGNEYRLKASDWLDIFELNDVENDFKQNPNADKDVSLIMAEFKYTFGDSIITAKDIDRKEYRKIWRKSIKLGIPIKELFRNYDLNYSGNIVNRLSSMQVTQIPYLDEMKALRDNLLLAQGITAENGYCKEEIFEAKVSACQQAYDKYKDKMFNFELDETNNLEDKELDF